MFVNCVYQYIRAINKYINIYILGSMNIKTVERYKYLGATLNKSLDFRESAQELAEAGGRALGGLISKFKIHKTIGYIYITVGS